MDPIYRSIPQHYSHVPYLDKINAATHEEFFEREEGPAHKEWIALKRWEKVMSKNKKKKATRQQAVKRLSRRTRHEVFKWA